jgi:NosR/NirI family transcriptional regulator, nitrous oxide reductase regulator
MATTKKSKSPLARYVRWLHTMWPAGTVEKLPEVQPDGSTNVPGLYVVGDLTGVPLLKFSSDTGARAVQTILADPSFRKGGDALDLVIVGAGVSGMAAALEAKKAGLRFEILEASEPFSTIVNFPKAKPIFTYPTDMKPAGDLQFRPEIHPKELLVEDIRKQTREIQTKKARAEKVVRKGGRFEIVLADGMPSLAAERVIVAIGRSGNFRKLGVPGEDDGKVFNRLHDPKEYGGKDVLVVGGGDSALETAIAVAECGGRVTISYRKSEFSRPKPDNVERLNKLMADPMADVQVENPTSERVTTAVGDYMGDHKKAGSIRLMLGSKVGAVRERDVDVVDSDGKKQTLPNDAVFAMIGREPPLDFFRRSGVRITGEWRAATVVACVAFLLFCTFLYNWKHEDAELPIQKAFAEHQWFPYDLPQIVSGFGGAISEWASREGNLLHTIVRSASGPAFYYTLLYCTLVVVFGIRRIRRRRTPYVKVQTITLMLVQCIPLFILPEIVLPWMGRNGMFSNGGAMQWLADHLFERYDAIGHERAYWRAYGFVLAFPLNVYNVFTDHPMWLWLVIAFVQTFVLIPLAIYRWGKGVYCGWMCSCGALAETLGDQHRHKMPHGPKWNRVNLVGQVVLAFAFVVLAFRIVGWAMGDGSWPTRVYKELFEGIPFLNYSWSVDVLLGGIVGFGLYFWFSGRVWCRFACPLAALMHVYARFSRFRILPEKKKCISCNVCTSVCHQGIDIMNFANKGLPMQDPECVRCSACVQMCPTGVLSFGEVNRKTGEVVHRDPAWLAASPVQLAEGAHPVAH